MHRIVRFLALTLGLMATLGGEARAEPLKVVASFSILGDFVSRVGGDEVAVTVLVGPDGDAHVFAPSPSAARAVAGADLVVVNGLGLEGWIERLVAASGYGGRVLVLSDAIRPREMAGGGGHDHDHDHREAADDGHAPDPHAWQDVANARAYVAALARALSEAAPERAAAFAANAAAYDRELAALDAWTRESLAAIPKDKRRVITSHDAFGYFAAAYGVEFLAPLGLSTDAEPSAAALGALVRQMRSERIRALFVENVTNPRMIDMLAREAGARPGPPLYSDALSRPGEGGETYVAMMRHNVAALVEGMRGN